MANFGASGDRPTADQQLRPTRVWSGEQTSEAGDELGRPSDGVGIVERSLLQQMEALIRGSMRSGRGRRHCWPGNEFIPRGISGQICIKRSGDDFSPG